MIFIFILLSFRLFTFPIEILPAHFCCSLIDMRPALRDPNYTEEKAREICFFFYKQCCFANSTGFKICCCISSSSTVKSSQVNLLQNHYKMPSLFSFQHFRNVSFSSGLRSTWFRSLFRSSVYFKGTFCLAGLL